MISIIGAGPVGNYLAYLLAKHGRKVNVYEEHDTIGLPVQCAGGVTSRIKELVPIRKQFLVNKIKRIKLYSPDGNFVEINLKEPNYIIDRMKFDRYLYEKAKDAGAKFFLGHKFLGMKDDILKFDKGLRKTKILVGADGPMSNVAKAYGLNKSRKFVICLQARVSGNFDGNTIEGYMNKDYCAAVIPEGNKVARINLISKNKINVNIHFKNFLKKFKGKVREYNSGLIPIYNPKLKAQKKNVYLVGDAAGHVKATTFGGIVTGMLAARELAKAIIKKKNYEKLWKKKIGKELKRHLSVRKRLNRFSIKDFNEFIRLIKQDKIKILLEKYDRDNLKKYAWKIFFKEPRFLKYVFM